MRRRAAQLIRHLIAAIHDGEAAAGSHETNELTFRSLSSEAIQLWELEILNSVRKMHDRCLLLSIARRRSWLAAIRGAAAVVSSVKALYYLLWWWLPRTSRAAANMIRIRLAQHAVFEVSSWKLKRRREAGSVMARTQKCRDLVRESCQKYRKGKTAAKMQIQCRIGHFELCLMFVRKSSNK